MRRWIDLFEEVSPPAILWHGSDRRVEAPYRPLTHFGTELAANQRAVAVNCDWKRAPEPTYGKDGPIYPARVVWMHPVHLHITNPLRVKDSTNLQHTPLKLADMLHYELRLISREDREAIFRVGNFGKNVSDNEAAARAIVEILGGKGYDGLVYTNLHEDPGSDSWVIFSGSQVTSAGDPQPNQLD